MHAVVQIHPGDGDRVLDHRRGRQELPVESEAAAAGELVHRLERLDQVVHALHADLHALADVGRDLALLQDALDVAEADHQIAQIVDHARRQPAHGAEPLHVQELPLRAAHLAQRCVELLRALREKRDQPLDGAGLVDVLAGLADRLEDVVGLPWLLQEAEDARAVDGADQRRRIGIAGEHDPGDVGLEAAQLLQHLHAAHVRHALVGDHHVEIDLLRQLQRLRPRLRLVDGVPGLEEVAQHREVRALVVDDQDSAAAGFPYAMQRDERAQTLVQHAARIAVRV